MSEHPISHPIAQWHALLEAKNPAALDTLLDDDVVFVSPIMHTPQRGKMMTSIYLHSAFNVFYSDAFNYVREIIGERDAMLEFETVIDDIHVNGVDIIQWNDEGKITEFKVMIRPLKAIEIVHQRMNEMLKGMQ